MHSLLHYRNIVPILILYLLYPTPTLYAIRKINVGSKKKSIVMKHNQRNAMDKIQECTQLHTSKPLTLIELKKANLSRYMITLNKSVFH